MKTRVKLFCFGFGQVARYFVKNLLKKKIDLELATTNTKKTELKKINNLKYKSYYFLDDKFDKNLLKDLTISKKILISIPPQKKTDIVLKTFYDHFQKKNFDWVTYLSATSVYGDKKGEWVDETTSPNPSSKNGLARLHAEKNWLKYYNEYNLPVQIFRLSGIYSLESNVVMRLRQGKQKIVEKPNHYFSRVHVEDIAGVLIESLNKFNPGEIYNISDNYPCSNEEIVKYAANLIKINLPEKIKLKDIKSEMLKSFYKSSKKISNKRMKDFFKYKLKYPTFKEGLNVIKNHQI